LTRAVTRSVIRPMRQRVLEAILATLAADQTNPHRTPE
jgi:hypothetical protein